MRKAGLLLAVLLGLTAVLWLGRDTLFPGAPGGPGERTSEEELGDEASAEPATDPEAQRPVLTAAQRPRLSPEERAARETAERAAAEAAARRGLVPFGGMLLDAGGRGVAGAQVTLVSAAGHLVVTADASGAFRTEVQPGRYDLLVNVPGRGALHIENYVIDGAARVDFELRLDPPATVTVILERDGRGLSGAAIDLRIAAWRWAVPAPAHQQTSDNFGRVTFTDVLPGTYELFARIPQGPALRQPLTVKADAEVRVVVPDAVEIFGDVTDAATGRPVAEALVALTTAEDKGPRLECTITTASDGTFRFSVPKGAPIAFTVTATGYAPWPPAREVNGVLKTLRGLAGSKPVQRSVALLLGGSVSGRLTQDGTGVPLPGINLAFQPRRGPVLVRATSAEEGRYAVPNLNAGRYDVVVETPGWFPLRPLVVEVPANATEPVVFDVLLAGSRVVNGVVVLPSGGAVGGARVWLTGGGQIVRSARNAGRALETFTGPDGTFTIAEVPPSVDVVARAALGSLEATPVGISAANPPTAPLRLLLAPTVDLTGRVTEVGGGDPVAGAQVRAVPRGEPWGRGWHNATADAEGRWRIDDLIPGEYDVTPSRAYYLPAAPRAVTLAPGAETAHADVVLDPGLVLAGWVTDESGRPVHALLRTEGTTDEGKSLQRSDATSPDGRFRLTGFVRGRYQIRVTAQGLAPRTVENLIGGEDRLRIALAATPPSGS